MTAFAARVLRSVRALGLLPPGARIGAAVSGGPDSTALILVLAELAPSLGVTVDCVIHVNHGLRGAAADDDAQGVAALAATAGIPCLTECVDVRAFARAHRCSIEAAGHQLRRRVFGRILRERGLDAVATGHTLDDQAETVLLRLIRGAGTPGLRGMSPRRGGIVRPLLGTRRRDIEAYLVQRGVTARPDASNCDLSIPRNRIRHELLPVLEERFSPRVRESLARAAAHVAADDDYFRPQVDAVLERFDVSPAGISFPSAALSGVALPVRRRIAQAVLQQLGIAQTTRRIEGLDSALTAGIDGRVTIGAISVSNDQGCIQVARAEGRNRTPRRGIESGRAEVAILGVGCPAAFGGWQVAVDDAAGAIDVVRPPGEAVIDADRVAWPLAVRGRRPGDRVRPIGALGRRKVQDILVDRKVPRASRGSTPIVVDALGRIVWVAGQVVAHDVRVTATTTRMLLLTLRPAGGAV